MNNNVKCALHPTSPSRVCTPKGFTAHLYKLSGELKILLDENTFISFDKLKEIEVIIKEE